MAVVKDGKMVAEKVVMMVVMMVAEKDQMMVVELVEMMDLM